MKKKKKWNALFFLCLIVLVAAVAAIVILTAAKNNRAKVYDELQTATLQTETELPETETEAEGTTAQTTAKPKPVIPVDFAALQEENNDIYAWIKIPDTPVDYPILHSAISGDDFYLDHTVERYEGLPGAIYTQYSHNPDLAKDKVTVIYGHNMLDGSMFGTLGNYLDETWRTEHETVLLYTPDHIYTYQIVLAVTFDDRLIPVTYGDFQSDMDYQQFLEDLQTERLLPSWIEEPFTVTTKDRMIVLSTCNSVFDQRVLVGAVLIDEE